MKRKAFCERGALFVEATIVFPIMFVIIFILLYAGNAYLQKSRVEKIVTAAALEGAARCADPMLGTVADGGTPGIDADIYPYRYFFSGEMDKIADEIETELGAELDSMSGGLFAGMEPDVSEVSVEFNNGFIYSTFSVDVEGKVKIPLRMLFEKEFLFMNVSCHMDVPVSDTSEFLRNVNMVEDYLEKFGIKEKIDDAREKLIGVINKIDEWKDKLTTKS